MSTDLETQAASYITAKNTNSAASDWAWDISAGQHGGSFRRIASDAAHVPTTNAQTMSVYAARQLDVTGTYVYDADGIRA
jgi:hypothetical protein